MSPERLFVRNFNRQFHALRCHAFHMEPRLCACGEPRRSNGKNCHACHAAAQRDYRSRDSKRRRANSPLAKLAAKHLGRAQ
jgi:hypothetical protein